MGWNDCFGGTCSERDIENGGVTAPVKQVKLNAMDGSRETDNGYSNRRGRQKTEEDGTARSSKGSLRSRGSAGTGSDAGSEEKEDKDADQLPTIQVVLAILAISIMSAAGAALLLYIQPARRTLGAELFGPIECTVFDEYDEHMADCKGGTPTPCYQVYATYNSSSRGSGQALIYRYFHSYFKHTNCSAHLCGDDAIKDMADNYKLPTWIGTLTEPGNGSDAFECYLDGTKPGSAFMKLNGPESNEIVMSRHGAYLVLIVPGTSMTAVVAALLYCFFSGHLTAEAVVEKTTDPDDYLDVGGGKFKRKSEPGDEKEQEQDHSKVD